MGTLRKIVALISVIVIVGLIIGMVICAVIESRYFFGMLALTFLDPIILWVFMWFTNLIKPSSDEIKKNTDGE